MKKKLFIITLIFIFGVVKAEEEVFIKLYEHNILNLPDKQILEKRLKKIENKTVLDFKVTNKLLNYTLIDSKGNKINKGIKKKEIPKEVSKEDSLKNILYVEHDFKEEDLGYLTSFLNKFRSIEVIKIKTGKIDVNFSFSANLLKDNVIIQTKIEENTKLVENINKSTYEEMRREYNKIIPKRINELLDISEGKIKLWENKTLENIEWIGQKDTIFKKCKGCWEYGVKKTNACCRQASEYMLGDTSCNDISGLGDVIHLAELKNINSWKKITDLKYLTNNFKTGIDYIENKIKNKNEGVLFGVHYEDRKEIVGNKINKATFHFMVIYSIGYDINQKKNYVTFYDAGRDNETTATFYLDILNQKIQGIYKDDKIYTITLIWQINTQQ